MANYVYGTIIVHSTDNSERLEEIVKVGIAEFYRPMPKALDITAPAHTKNEKMIAEANMVRYGVTDWYDWRRVNHGTKWSDYQHELNGDIFTFTSAWSPISFDIIKMFALDFPNMTYEWEEEQGYGERYEFRDGEVVEEHEWDIPSWSDNKTLSEDDIKLCDYHNVGWLSKEYNKIDETFEVGFYYDSNLEEFIGTTIEEVRKSIADLG